MTIETSLANHVLIAMPFLTDPNFEKSVIYVCENHSQGTVGLIINHPTEYQLSMVFEQLHILPLRSDQSQRPLLFGGPIQPERGFVIHRPSGDWRSSLSLQHDVTVTTSNDIIRAIAEGKGPQDALITLGYVSWELEQLGKEIRDNFWLVSPCKPELLYEVPFLQRWKYAGSIIGVDMAQLSSETGHA